MAHKNEYELYLLSRKHAGYVAKAPELLELFGYSKKTNLCDTRLIKFLKRVTPYKEIGIYEVRKLAAVTEETIVKHSIGAYKNKRIVYRRLNGFKKDGQLLFLVSRYLVPFWLLKEFGGDIE